MPLYLEKNKQTSQRKVSSAVLVVLTASPSVNKWIFSCFNFLSNFPAGLLLEVWCSDPLRWLFGFKSTNTVFSELFSWKFVSVCGILLDFVDFSSISHLKIANKENLRAHVDHDFHDFFFSLSLSLCKSSVTKNSENKSKWSCTCHMWNSFAKSTPGGSKGQ